jgi:hypothetical protein
MALLGTFGGGAMPLFLWPALSFGVAAVAYFRAAPSAFGKRVDGRLSLARVAVFLPYLVLTWTTWSLARAIDRAPAWSRLTDSV